jgi:hypothetical protein
MNASTARRPANPLEAFLAGLQAGTIGICWTLAWMGFSAAVQGRSFWTAENLMATVLQRSGTVSHGFGAGTVRGLAVYLLAYSLFGAAFASAVGERFTGAMRVLLGVVVSVGWYCLWFRMWGQTAMPLVWLLHAERATEFGHVIFGILVARFPMYLERTKE